MTALLIVLLGLTAQVQSAEPLEPLELLPLDTATPVPATSPAEPAPPAANTFPPGTTLFVNASSLALRSEPRRDSTLIHYMPRDAKVYVVKGDIDPVPDRIGDTDGHWIYVQHTTHYGWTFDAFLAGAPPTLEENLDWACVPGKRVGPITATTTFEELVSTFGQTNVGEAKIPVADGKFEAGAVVFPESPEKRLFIQWAYPNKSVHSVIVEGSRWKTPAGIGIRTRLADIVQANGGPFSFAGFEWDYSGYIMSWKGGLLERDHVLGDTLFIYLAPQPPYLPSDYDALRGDKEFSSDMPEAGKLNLSVRAMTVLLRE